MRSHRQEPSNSPAGSKLGLSWLMPGGAHWLWGQRERAFQLASAYFSMLLVGTIAWGTLFGLFMWLLAFGVHALSMCDALRQAAFPGFGRFGPYFSTSTGLGLTCYLPALLTASTFAWPGIDEQDGKGVMVNRLAYRGHEPKRGDHLWLANGEPGRRPHLARVIAGANQEIDWSNDRLRIDGKPTEFLPFLRGTGPSQLTFRIPEGQLLVSFPVGEQWNERWGLVARNEVSGKAWGRLYPVWNRGLLE